MCPPRSPEWVGRNPSTDPFMQVLIPRFSDMKRLRLFLLPLDQMSLCQSVAGSSPASNKHKIQRFLLGRMRKVGRMDFPKFELTTVKFRVQHRTTHASPKWCWPEQVIMEASVSLISNVLFSLVHLKLECHTSLHLHWDPIRFTGNRKKQAWLTGSDGTGPKIYNCIKR
jgi:hypothetical protein